MDDSVVVESVLVHIGLRLGSRSQHCRSSGASSASDLSLLNPLSMVFAEFFLPKVTLVFACTAPLLVGLYGAVWGGMEIDVHGSAP